MEHGVFTLGESLEGLPVGCLCMFSDAQEIGLLCKSYLLL